MKRILFSHSYFLDVALAYKNETPRILVTGEYQTNTDVSNFKGTIIGMEFSTDGNILWKALLDSPISYMRGIGCNIILVRAPHVARK